MALHAQLSGDPPDLAVWGEGALDPGAANDAETVADVEAAIAAVGSPTLVGAVLDDPDGTQHTSVVLLNGDGEPVDRYDKVHLVPFGEYLPFRPLFDLLGIRQLVAIPEGFSFGASRLTLTVPGAAPFAPLICYEIIFPGAVVASGPRPGWMLNLTNDTWFGDTPGPHQHFLQGRVRSVEEGLPLIRAANSGISAIVDSHGRIVDSLGLDSAGIIDGNIPEDAAFTLYTRLGDWLFFGVLACAVGVSQMARIFRGMQRN
jgi:apolipoprotein N-acyltransferase